MIKQCPTCKRTYSDETISFCLADGSLLSPPFERDSADSRSAADTAVMPPPALPKATEASPLPTIAAPPPKAPRQTTTDEAPKRSKLPFILPLTAIPIVAVVLIIGYFLMPDRRGEGNEVASANGFPSPEVTVTPTPASPTPTSLKPTPSVSPNRTSEAPTTPADSPAPKSQDADPVLFPPDKKEPDKDKVYSPREVDQRVRILSQPKPSYTEDARKNQIQGVVTLRVVFAANGTVTDIRAINGLPNGLTERAIAAAKQIRFEPATKDGVAVSVSMQLQYNFNLY